MWCMSKIPLKSRVKYCCLGKGCRLDPHRASRNWSSVGIVWKSLTSRLHLIGDFWGLSRRLLGSTPPPLYGMPSTLRKARVLARAKTPAPAAALFPAARPTSRTPRGAATGVSAAYPSPTVFLSFWPPKIWNYHNLKLFCSGSVIHSEPHTSQAFYSIFFWPDGLVFNLLIVGWSYQF